MKHQFLGVKKCLNQLTQVEDFTFFLPNYILLYLFSKRVFDIVLSLFGLIGSAPFLCLGAILIKLDSRGPIMYKANRVGKGRIPFQMYKFRTMVINADKIGGSSTPDDDPRITRMGKFMRKYKLDEFPQLINVLKGNMSFVGPRPQIQWAVDLYTLEHLEVLNVAPGITDYASLRFPNEGEILSGSTDPDKDYMEKIHPEKMRLSLEYIRNRSFFGDILIILKTIASII